MLCSCLPSAYDFPFVRVFARDAYKLYENIVALSHVVVWVGMVLFVGESLSLYNINADKGNYLLTDIARTQYKETHQGYMRVHMGFPTDNGRSMIYIYIRKERDSYLIKGFQAYLFKEFLCLGINSTWNI